MRRCFVLATELTEGQLLLVVAGREGPDRLTPLFMGCVHGHVAGDELSPSLPCVGICSIAFRKRSPSEALRSIAAAGADSVELWGQPPHLPYPVDVGWCVNLRQEAEELGLHFCALGSYFRPGAHPAYEGHVVTKENQLAAAQALGAPIVRIWPGETSHATTAHTERERLYSEIRDFADAAQDVGIMVVLERHVGSLTEGWEAPLTVLAEVGHSAVSLNYQVVFPAPQEDLVSLAVADYVRLLPHSRHAHLQNYISSASEQPCRSLIEEGIVDYKDLGSTARDCGFEGSFMIEFPADERSSMSVDEAVCADVAGVRRLLTA